MIINVHAGHCPDGKGASGAVGVIKESTENRRVKDEVIRLLRVAGHTVYDCTCDEEKTKSDCLKYIVSKCNAHKADFDLSIHFNAGANDMKGNDKQTGTEIWARDYNGIKGEFANRYLDGMQKLGFKSRGKKTTTGLYVLNKTDAKAALIEVVFVDDFDDCAKYKSVGYKAVAKVVAEAIHGKTITETASAVKGGSASVNFMTICKGCKGTDVGKAQSLLKYLGYYKGEIDEDFGKLTEAAVNAFKAKIGREQNGILDVPTWSKLAGH